MRDFNLGLMIGGAICGAVGASYGVVLGGANVTLEAVANGAGAILGAAFTVAGSVVIADRQNRRQGRAHAMRIRRFARHLLRGLRKIKPKFEAMSLSAIDAASLLEHYQVPPELIETNSPFVPEVSADLLALDDALKDLVLWIEAVDSQRHEERMILMAPTEKKLDDLAKVANRILAFCDRY